MMRRVKVQRGEPEAVRQQLLGLPALKVQLSRLDEIHFNSGILDPEGGSDSAQALVLMSKRDLVRGRQDAAIEAGFVLESCDMEPVAIFNLLSATAPDVLERVRGTGVLVIGEEYVQFMLCDAVGPHSARAMSIGIDVLVRDVAMQNSSIPAETIREILLSRDPEAVLQFQDVLDAWVSRLADMVTPAKTGATSTRSINMDQLLIMGEGALIGGLVERVAQIAELQTSDVEIFNPLAQPSVTLGSDAGILKEDGPLWCLPMGLAIGLMEE